MTKTKENMVRRPIVFHPDLWKQIQEYAFANNTTPSLVVELFLTSKELFNKPKQ